MPSTKIESLLQRNKQAIDAYILSFLPKGHEIPEIDLLHRMVKDYPSRLSKGLRSTLCMLVCEALGGSQNQSLPTAAALELFQNWVLIHDDIEDGSEMRRGEPVLHRKYGIPLAINAGDALHAKMWEALLKNRAILGDRKTWAVMKEFSRMVNETTEGQHIELTWVEKGRWDLSEEDYYLMCEKKTSWYTCISPSRLGAIIADADQRVVDQMIPFGRSLGIAFQIQDDILNLIGEEGRYGKEVAGDLWESKRTLILIRLLIVCNAKERERVLNVMSKRREDKMAEEVSEVLSLIKEKKAIDYATVKAREFADDAKASFERIFQGPSGVEAQERLREFIDFMITRRW